MFFKKREVAYMNENSYNERNKIIRYDAEGASGGWYGVHDFYTGYNGATSTLTMRLKNGNVEVNSLASTYTGGSAYVCVYDSGVIYASEIACP
jgi:hypothetical protein